MAKKDYPVVEIDRKWAKSTSDQAVDTHSGMTWRVSDLIQIISDLGLKPFELPLAHIDLHSPCFRCEDLYEFAQHCLHVNESDDSYPIIMTHRGQILDGRHRIVKKLLNRETFIMCYRLPYDVRATRTQ